MEHDGEMSDIDHVKAAIKKLEADRALQIVGRQLTEEEKRRIARASAALPHLQDALKEMEKTT